MHLADFWVFALVEDGHGVLPGVARRIGVADTGADLAQKTRALRARCSGRLSLVEDLARGGALIGGKQRLMIAVKVTVNVCGVVMPAGVASRLAIFPCQRRAS
jgi:hypothetical protein